MALSKFTTGGAFFKAAEHLEAEVILFEPTRLERQVPGSRFGPKDIVTANITVFHNDAEPQVFAGAKVDGKALVSDLEGYIDQQIAARVVVVPNTNGGKDFPVLRQATPQAEAKVEKYLAERDAAMADAPAYLQ